MCSPVKSSQKICMLMLLGAQPFQRGFKCGIIIPLYIFHSWISQWGHLEVRDLWGIKPLQPPLSYATGGVYHYFHRLKMSPDLGKFHNNLQGYHQLQKQSFFKAPLYQTKFQLGISHLSVSIKGYTTLLIVKQVQYNCMPYPKNDLSSN